MPASRRAMAIGLACGASSALCWAIGFVTARYGILIGFTPADLTFHRYVWAGLLFLLPFFLMSSRKEFGAIGWRRGLALTLFSGPLLAMLSYVGFTLVPLGHGAVIQPSSAAVSGIFLASIFLCEHLRATRIAAAITIVLGLVIFGFEAVTTMGAHGLLGDAAFLVAGLFWGAFGTLLRRWRIAPTQAVIIVHVIALVFVPIYWRLVGFENMLRLGWSENALQILIQGVFAGPLAVFLFTRAVALLGGGRAAVFPALVPGFALLIGYVMLGETPSAIQLVGFAIVLVGFRFAMKA